MTGPSLDLAEKKRIITRKRRAAERERRRISRRCFWTWPLGHVWAHRQFEGWTCEVCGKTQRIIW